MLSNTGYRNDFEVDPWVHWLGKLVEQGDGLCRRAGGWETRMLSDPLAAMEIDRPVYIAGLARSGTTKLLEILSWHDDVVTHRYRDFPLLHVPYLWNRFLDFVPRRHLESRERAHRDGIYINPDSPEAFEEVLWMSFFPQLHDPAKNSVLDAHTSRPDFESFYRDHIRKLLLVRGGSRYVSKGNYNITRLEYLLRIFPGARFIIPVREPVWHIASLMKQHKLFCKAQKDNPKALTHLRRAGHFEFGLDRRPINTGDHEEVERILALWNSGREVDGWARYWDHTHAFIADRLAHNPALREAAIVVRYEDFCRRPAATVRAILEHCGLSAPRRLLQRAGEGVRFPGYYRPRFDRQDLEAIRRLTRETAARFGLGGRSREAPGAGAAPPTCSAAAPINTDAGRDA